MSKTALRYTRRDDAQARIQDLDTALGYPRVHGVEAQITPGAHVPLGMAVTTTCGVIVEQKDGSIAVVLSDDAITALTPPEKAALIKADRKESLLDQAVEKSK